MTSFTLNLISIKVSFNDIFKKTLNITPVNITSFTVVKKARELESHCTITYINDTSYHILMCSCSIFRCGVCCCGILDTDCLVEED